MARSHRLKSSNRRFCFERVCLSIEYHHCQVFLAYPAIKQLALSRLKTAVDNYFVNYSQQQSYSLYTSYRSGDRCQVVYVSNVAFTSSKLLNIPPLEIAQDFVNVYAPTPDSEQYFTFAAVAPGFLQLKLTEPKLAIWLQCLPFLLLRLDSLPRPKYCHPLTNDASVFVIQYTHARCYSLMQLAQKEGLISLEEIAASSIKSRLADFSLLPLDASILTIAWPQPLPWLSSPQQLQFCHQCEYALITQLVKVVDELCCCDLNLDCLAKTALNLSKAFADFYRDCRIFGKTNAQNPKLSQAQLGLVLGTYVVIKVILQRLGVFAPQEL
jgi:DALR anticodon binding domain